MVIKLIRFLVSKLRCLKLKILFGVTPARIEEDVDIEVEGRLIIGSAGVFKKGSGICVEKSGCLQIGDKFFLGRYSFIKCYGGSIKVGENVSLNAFVFINGAGDIDIGNNVRIGAHTSIISSNHIFKNVEVPICEQGLSLEGVRIENDVWIGTGVRVLDGVTIGEGSVIAAGAVVTKSIPPYTVFGGVPAKFIRHR